MAGIICGRCGHRTNIIRVCNDICRCKVCKAKNLNPEERDYTLKEWLNFNYLDYLDFIQRAIDEDQFELLAAISDKEIELGRLTPTQINKLKTVLSQGFTNNHSIIDIENAIADKVAPKSLYREEAGEKILSVSGERRPYLIARTETTRLANLGTLNMFASQGIEEYQWVTTWGDRTCPDCEALDGQMFTLAEKNIIAPPLHVNCRCTMLPVIRG